MNSATFGTSSFGMGSNFNMASMMKMSDISGEVQQHLVRVYAALAATLLAASFGVVLHLQTHIGGLLTLLASIGCMVWLSTEQDQSKRYGILLGMGLFQGASIGGLVEVALMVDPSIVLTAVVATTLVFACFSLASLLAKRRSYLYLGGTLSSMLSMMMFTSLFRFILPGMFVFNVQIYVGLLVFCGYVLFDTQMIVEKAELGDRDFLNHAMQLFVDFVAIFVRVLIILLKNSGKKSERRDRR